MEKVIKSLRSVIWVLAVMVLFGMGYRASAQVAGELDQGFINGKAGFDASETITTAMQPDGKILVGRAYSSTRLNADGTQDTDFNLAYGINASIHAFYVQPDGKIVVGGGFSCTLSYYCSNYPIHGFGRLNSDGSVDATFNPGGAGASGGGLLLLFQM